MSDELTIQCDNCGTIYSHLEEVCPYCGQPPAPPVDDYALSPEDYYPDAGGYPAETFDEGAYAEPQGVYAESADEYLDQVGGYVEDGYAAGELFDLDNSPTEYGWFPGAEAYETDYEAYDGTYEDEYALETGLEEEGLPRRFTWGRIMLGCLGLFVCIGLLYGTVGLFAAYNGLRERALNTQAEAELHYQRGQEQLADNNLELAIAEFEMALSLNPNFLEARQALRDAQSTVASQPTPTSETRSAAAATLLATAEEQVKAENWAEAAQTLSQVRDLDPDYRVEYVSELIYNANYQLGLQLLTPDQIDEAAAAFERAQAARPEDPEVKVELAKASLYLEGRAAEANDQQKAVDSFSLLYRQDANYLDVGERLASAHIQLGDVLAADGDWCLAEVQYLESIDLQPDENVQAKAETSKERCQESRPAAQTTRPPTPQPTTAAAAGSTAGGPANPTPTAEAEGEAEAATAGSGGDSIVFSAFNPYENRWEIQAVPVSGGTPKTLVINGTMPAVSPNGKLLVYHSELIESEGFHLFNLTTGEDNRITLYKNHILPRWGSDNQQFIFVAQELGTGRWQIFQGFADGKSDPIILRDGRTPDWSPDQATIAYQGTDEQGNNPGIYLVPFGGGETIRLTDHESDRSPDFSPNGAQLAYMSTRDGNWNIYVTSVNGGAPRKLTNNGNNGLPRWSPDGSQIAYVSDMGGSWAIYTINAGGGTPVKVTPWDGIKHPDWLQAQIDWGR